MGAGADRRRPGRHRPARAVARRDPAAAPAAGAGVGRGGGPAPHPAAHRERGGAGSGAGPRGVGPQGPGRRPRSTGHGAGQGPAPGPTAVGRRRARRGAGRRGAGGAGSAGAADVAVGGSAHCWPASVWARAICSPGPSPSAGARPRCSATSSPSVLGLPHDVDVEAAGRGPSRAVRRGRAARSARRGAHGPLTTRRTKAAKASGWREGAPWATRGTRRPRSRGRTSTSASMARRWWGTDRAPAARGPGARGRSARSNGGRRRRRSASSATSAGPSAWRSARACSVSRSQPASPTTRRKKPSAKSAGSSVGDARRDCAAATSRTRERRLVGADGPMTRGAADGGAQGHVATVGVADDDRRAARPRSPPGRSTWSSRERGQGHGAARAVVAPAVVGDDVEVGEAANDAGETRAAVERSVDQDDDRRGSVGPRPRVVDNVQTGFRLDRGPVGHQSGPSPTNGRGPLTRQDRVSPEPAGQPRRAGGGRWAQKSKGNRKGTGSRRCPGRLSIDG